MMIGLIKKCQDSAHQRFSFRGGAQCFEREAQYAGFVVAFVSYSGTQIVFRIAHYGVCIFCCRFDGIR